MMKDNNSLQYNMLPVHRKVLVSIKEKDYTSIWWTAETPYFVSINKLIFNEKTAKGGCAARTVEKEEFTPLSAWSKPIYIQVCKFFLGPLWSVSEFKTHQCVWCLSDLPTESK